VCLSLSVSPCLPLVFVVVLLHDWTVGWNSEWYPSVCYYSNATFTVSSSCLRLMAVFCLRHSHSIFSAFCCLLVKYGVTHLGHPQHEV